MGCGMRGTEGYGGACQCLPCHPTPCIASAGCRFPSEPFSADPDGRLLDSLRRTAFMSLRAVAVAVLHTCTLCSYRHACGMPQIAPRWRSPPSPVYQPRGAVCLLRKHAVRRAAVRVLDRRGVRSQGQRGAPLAMFRRLRQGCSCSCRSAGFAAASPTAEQTACAAPTSTFPRTALRLKSHSPDV